MKQSDIKQCVGCGEGVMHDNQMTFYTVKITQWVVDLGAVQRQHGMEQMMGQAAALAQVMGPNEDIAKPLEAEKDVWVCGWCANTERMADIIDKAGL